MGNAKIGGSDVRLFMRLIYPSRLSFTGPSRTAVMFSTIAMSDHNGHGEDEHRVAFICLSVREQASSKYIYQIDLNI